MDGHKIMAINIMNPSKIYLSKLTLSIFLVTCFGAYAINHIIKEEDNFIEKHGPKLILNNLNKDGVFNTPSFEWTSSYDGFKLSNNVKGLFFEGLKYKGKSTKVFCWYGVPKNLKEGEKAPAVILVHGGGGTAFEQWVKKWNDEGFIAISIALEGQIPGEKVDDVDGNKVYQRLTNSGPHRVGFFNDVKKSNLKDQWFYHAVSDVMLAHSLLNSFPEVDAENIGITGISWGGIITNVVTGLDKRFKFSIPVYGCGFLYETPLYDRLLNKLTQEGRDFYMNNWEPSLYIPLQDLPTLFINGTNDKHFTMNSFTKSFNTSKSEKYLRIEHNMRHGHAPGWNSKEIYAFANYVVANGKSPILVKLEMADNNSVLYSVNNTIKKAKLYYTSQVNDWGEKNYEWKESLLPVTVSNNQIHAQIPSDALYIFLNVYDETDNMYSSSMSKI